MQLIALLKGFSPPHTKDSLLGLMSIERGCVVVVEGGLIIILLLVAYYILRTV